MKIKSEHALTHVIYSDSNWNFMTLTKAEYAHFNDLRFMSEVNFKHSFHDITSDIVLCFHDHEDSKKTLSEFIHVTNAENSALLLTDHHPDPAVEAYQDSQKAPSEFTHTTYINNFIISFCHHDSDSVIEFSSFSMHDNHADIFIIALASHSCY